MTLSRKLLSVAIFLSLLTSVPAEPIDEKSETSVDPVNNTIGGTMDSSPVFLIKGTMNISVNSLNASQENSTFADSMRSILSLSALILGLVNGLILLRTI